VVSGDATAGALPMHTHGETMLGTKREWLCNAIVALVILLALGLVCKRLVTAAGSRA
jgi:hypothetical protein